MSKKLKYKIISCSSEESQFPSSSLLFGGQNGGWQTKRFCTYPQQVTFQFYGPVKVEKIEIISDNRKVPSQVDILYFMPFQGRLSEERFQKYGYLNFNRNENSQLREQKSIMVDIKCLYLRFLLHKPHSTKQNFFSQIGIQQITVYGNDVGSTFAPVQKLPRQIGQTTGGQDSFNAGDDDPFVVEKLAILNSEKQKAVQAQDYESANEYKMIIDAVKKAGEELRRLNLQKRKAIEQEDYQKANGLKKSIQKHRKQLDELISFGYDQNDNNMQENEFVQQPNQPTINDFQDNEFVDPQMNQMIEKSGAFSGKGQNSRVIGGTSRMKINKSILIRKQNLQQKENYDDRVIPTLAAGSKMKTEESQVMDDDGKKLDLKLEEIDGKYIQYSMIMQEHFQQDTVKRFFSQYWQHKVEALGTILSQTKNKQNADASFIKCLLTVVKNCVSQTNFQVAQSSLQLFSDLLKMNAKGSILTRNNELANDLDSISKEVVKKMTDNNNKIRLQAERAVGEMIGSALYGAEVCTGAMTKSKQKVKLSAKQLLSRLGEVYKIVGKNSANQQILTMATDFAIQNAKNPSGQVRNEAMNLLVLCRDKDTSGIVQKKISDKNLLQLIEVYESKAQSKGTQKVSKGKKLK